MGFKIVETEIEGDGFKGSYEKVGVDGTVTLQDFVSLFNTEGLPMTFVEVKRGRQKGGENEKEEKGALNFILEAINLWKYREALAALKPPATPEDKAVKALMKYLGISQADAEKRVSGQS